MHYKYPNLWRGCVGAWAPCLGETGSILLDRSGRKQHAKSFNSNWNTLWTKSDGLPAVHSGLGNFRAPMSYVGNVTHGSLTGWFRPTTHVVWSALISMRNNAEFGNGHRAIIGYNGNNQITGDWYDASYNNTTGLYAVLGEWNFVAVVTAGITLSVYHSVPDVKITQSVYTTNNAAQNAIDGRPFSGTCVLGADTTSSDIRAIDGLLDDIRIYDRALSPAEVAQLASKRGAAYETSQSPALQLSAYCNS